MEPLGEGLQPADALRAVVERGRAEEDRERLHRLWKQRLEQAQYEVDRGRRQYDAVDPENRLVARKLERQWE